MIKDLKHSFISLLISYKLFFIISSFTKTNKKVIKECKPQGRLVIHDEIAAMDVYVSTGRLRSTIGSVMVVYRGMNAK